VQVSRDIGVVQVHMGQEWYNHIGVQELYRCTGYRISGVQ